jgi:hypothetical protein
MSTEIIEEAILEALRKVPRERWGLVLEILHNLEPREAQIPEGTPAQIPEGTDPTLWTLEQLLALPPAEREAIMEAQVLLAVEDYPVGLDDDYSDYFDDTDAPAR